MKKHTCPLSFLWDRLSSRSFRKTPTCRVPLLVLMLLALGLAAAPVFAQMVHHVDPAPDRPALLQPVIFVDASATGAGNGSSWADAYPGVQPALNAATNGQQVWVAAGRYVGTITLRDGVALYGGFAGIEDPATFDLADRDLTANETILDGNQAGSVVTSPSGATAATRIDGFTITNGTGTLSGSYRYGGGLYLFNSSPTITNNIITSNSATWSGGGLCVFDSDSTVAHNRITNNFARFGGGLYVLRSSLTITNNTITGNSAAGNSLNCFGGGLCLAGSSSTITNNMIAGNSAERAGGGLHLERSSPTIVNNTIAGNGAEMAGGMSILDYCSPIIANTIVAFNSSGVYRYGTSGAPTLRNNCVFGNTAYNYSGLTDPTGANGNISVDPRLADPRYGNVHLQPDSPCVDAGTNGLPFGDSDPDGQPRIQPAGGTVDIGADESDGTVWLGGPYAIVRVSPDGDDEHDGSSWDVAKRTVQAGINAASLVGGEVWVQTGTYRERIFLHPYAYVYGGFTGGETEQDERDWRINVTTLDGQQQGSVVTARGGYAAVNAIDGFTIINGSGTLSGGNRCGGGLYLYYSSSTIANNTITGNNAGGYSGQGGGLYLFRSSPTITNNTIMGNSGSPLGGGLYVLRSSPMIANNTITGNIASAGGGLLLSYSSPTIANNIVAFNASGIHGYAGAPTLRHNCVYGNDAYNFRDIADPTGTNGNISVGPLFVQYPDDLHLLADSPCVDAGSNGHVSGDLDLDGEPRIVDGDENGIAVVDMGAYEYYWAGLPCDLDSDGDVDGADYAVFRAAFRRSVGQPGYNSRCDYDHSGTVGLNDYQAWLACYRDFVGNPQAGPPPLPDSDPGPNPTPAPAPAPAPVHDSTPDHPSVPVNAAPATPLEQSPPPGRR